MVCFSCQRSHVGTIPTLTDSIVIDKTSHLFDDTNKPACNIHVNFTYLKDNSDPSLRDSVNAILISQTFSNSYASLKPNEAADKYVENYILRYHKDLESDYEEQEREADKEILTEWYSYYESVETEVLGYSPYLLTYTMHYEDYTGGVHGSYATHFCNIDLRHLHMLTLSDIFIDDFEESVTDLLWQQLIKDVNAKNREEAEEMGFGILGELAPTENFCLTPEGIEFHYNIYEIAPYAMGATTITIPYKQLRPWLNTQNEIIKQLL